MKQYFRAFSVIVLSSVVLAAVAVPAYAQTSTTTTTTAQTPAKFEDICQRIKNRLNVRVGNVTNAKDENTTIYEGLNKRLEKVIEAAKKKQYDTTELESALTKTRAAIGAYDTANKSYTTELTSTANTVCQSETTYALTIASTRASLKAARDAGLAARNTFQYNVIPELRAYKVWLTAQAAGTTEDAATEQPAAEGAL